MLPRSRRATREDFKTARVSARFKQHPIATVRFFAHQDSAPAKVAVVVSKAVLRGAVKRNRLKRQSLAIVGTLLPLLKPYTFLIFFNKKAVNLPFAELKDGLGTLLAEFTQR